MQYIFYKHCISDITVKTQVYLTHVLKSVDLFVSAL